MMESPAPKLSVLVADDTEEMRAVVAGCLEAAGYDVTCVATGAEAKRALTNRYFDIVVTDILMPDADGIEVIHDVRKRYPTTRILAMTGGGHVLDPMYCVKLARSMGANGALLKPFTASQFVDALKAITSTPEAE